MKDNGIFKIAAVILGVAAVGLLIALIHTNQKSAEQIAAAHKELADLTNQLAQVTKSLEDNKQVVTNLETDLTARKADINTLSNDLATATANLAQTQTALTNAQEEIAKRDAAIAKLEQHNKELEQQGDELNAIINRLNDKIADTAAKLTASEGDKAALTKELKRLIAEKAELERKFNDITALREQVKKIKTKINIARRLDRAAEGLPASSEPKGALKQMSSLQPQPPRIKHYDLNVEVNSDGTVKVIPPLINTNTNN